MKSDKLGCEKEQEQKLALLSFTVMAMLVVDG